MAKLNHQVSSRSERDTASFIQDLQNDLDRDKEARLKVKAKMKEYRAFMKLPRYSPRMEFWCDDCAIDFVAPAFKQWIETHRMGTWQSFCPICWRWVYRHITSKVADPYYFKSEKLAIMRGASASDLLQPGQYGFKTLHGDPFAKYYYRFQQRHEEMWGRYAAMGLAGRTLAQQEEEEMTADDIWE